MRNHALSALALAAFCFGASMGFLSLGIPPPCQKYCPVLYDNTVTLQCCSYVVKDGECPVSEVPTYDSSWNLVNLHCFFDADCPMGYKCCREANYKQYRVCKWALQSAQCRPESPEVGVDEKYDVISTSGDGSGSGCDDDYDDENSYFPPITMEPEVNLITPVDVSGDGSGDSSGDDIDGSGSGEKPLGREDHKLDTNINNDNHFFFADELEGAEHGKYQS